MLTEVLVQEKVTGIDNHVEIPLQDDRTHPIKMTSFSSSFRSNYSTRGSDSDSDQLSRLEQQVGDLKTEIVAIKRRNEEKDQGKEFEGSYTRVLFIMAITYGTLYGYMRYLGVQDPELNAIIPAIGFNLSTWSIPYVKCIWLALRNKCRRQPPAQLPVVNDTANNISSNSWMSSCYLCENLCVNVTDDDSDIV